MFMFHFLKLVRIVVQEAIPRHLVLFTKEKLDLLVTSVLLQLLVVPLVGAIGPLSLDREGVSVQLAGLLGELAGALPVVRFECVGVVGADLILG